MNPFDQYKIPYKVYKNFLLWFCDQFPSFKISDFYKFLMEEQQTFNRLAGFVWGAVAVFRLLLLGWGWTGEIRGGAAPMACGWIWTWPSCATALEGWILFFLIRAWLIPTYTKFQMILHYAPTHAYTSTYKHFKTQRLITWNFCKYCVSELQNGCNFLLGDMSCPVQELRTRVLTISWFIFNRPILHLSYACIILNSVWHIHMGTCELWALHSTFIMYCNIFSLTTTTTSS